ncbi:hypothetical protein AC249_AIPGENE11291 [Exaiptasia diaphana]|nr:hypothetical protein AC249_AIPGENE11291 [Exaiptasia diaphana]
MDRWVKKYKVSYREEGKHTTYKTVQNEEDEDKGVIKMRGISKLKIYCRRVMFFQGSKLDLRAPSITQKYGLLRNRQDGDDGKHGQDGPSVEVFAHKVYGYIDIEASGGDGNKGQNGADGRAGADRSGETQPIYTRSECFIGWFSTSPCITMHSRNGIAGGDGGDGGYAGKSGLSVKPVLKNSYTANKLLGQLE